MSFQLALDDEIKRRERLAHVTSLGGDQSPARSGRRPAMRAASKAKAAPVKRRVSPKMRAMRVQQGRYLGAIRPLCKQNRARVKAIREESGVNAAVSAAKRLSAAPKRKTRSHPARKAVKRMAKRRAPKKQEATKQSATAS